MEGEYLTETSGGSFWENITSASSAEIDAMLTSPYCQIEDLLGSEAFLQEFKSHHQELIKFTIQPSSIAKMIKLITQEPEDDATDKRRYKLPFIANEVFCSRINLITSNLLKTTQPSLFKLLWQFLDNPPPLNPVLAGYFLYTVKAIMDTIRAQQYESPFNDYETISCLFKHLQSPSIAELILYFSEDKEHVSHEAIATGLVKTLQQLADGEIDSYTTEIADNTAMILNQILGPTLKENNYYSWFKANTGFEETLIQLISSNKNSLVKAGIIVFGTWLFSEAQSSFFIDTNWSFGSIDFFQDLLTKFSSNKILEERCGDFDSEEDKSELSAVNSIDNRLKRILYPNLLLFKELLKPNFGEDGKLFISLINIEVLKFLFTFLTAHTMEAAELLIKENILSEIVELFFDFPWNNIMHSEASKIFTCLLCLGVNNYKILEAFFSKTSFLKKSFEIILLHNEIIKLNTKEERRKNMYLVGGLASYIFNFFYLLKLASYHSTWIDEFINVFPFWKSFYITDLQNLLNTRVKEGNKAYAEDYEKELENGHNQKLLIRKPNSG